MPPLVRRTISDRAQLKALVSPVRQELIDLLARTGPASAAELGKLIRRPADGLYYHLRALQRAGLVSSAGRRVRSGRHEALFHSTHREPALRHDPSPGGNSPAVTAIVATMLRLGIRDFWKAFLEAASDPVVRPVFVEGTGDVAYEIGEYQVTLRNPQGGGTSRQHGKYLVVWKRQSDRSLKMVADMFSPNE